LGECKIVLVGTEYPINLGYCARVLANFGHAEMNLVFPKAKIGKTAIMHAKHAKRLLEKAKIYQNIEDATRDCDFVVGTTGITSRGNETLRSPINLEKFAKKTEETNGRIAILFGREGTGLSAEEIKRCDFLVSIPTSKNYPVLNLSHALAIVLYRISRTKHYGFGKEARKSEKDELAKTFSEITDLYGSQLRNGGKIKLAFRRMIGRSMVSDLEAAALLCVFKKAKEEIKKTRNR